MPFTPFHMGPGLALKAVAGRHVSLMLFGFSQVMIDLEPAIRILRNDPFLHGFTHTYLGATLVALVSVALGRPICQRLLDHWKPDSDSRFLSWLRGSGRISFTAALWGAFLGTFTHVALDSIMHFDMDPMAPISSANPLLRVVSIGWLHVFCVASGLVGAVVLVSLFWLRGKSSGPAESPWHQN
ncbi:MAG TPA: hypothetical protein VNF03_08585 [Patescibacteria group bacterium]|nr:hypothetical protein [Patescibacteria group bacterium]